MLISVVICTRNRADDLRETLHSLAAVAVPGNCEGEVLVIDNGSQDHTSAVIAEASLPNLAVRRLHEPVAGQSNARNLGLSEAGGEIIVFTDDDLRFSPDWLEAMTAPIRSRQADAVTGAMRLAPHLERPWMGPMHRIWLAAPLDAATTASELVGANMAFRREVLNKVPRFDPELGPGAFGFGDDTLFSYQLGRAGYQIATVPLGTEHHFRPERLMRDGFLAHAKKLGETGAYLAHHWAHQNLGLARLNLLRKICHLAVWRKAQPAEWQKMEGMHPSEMHHLRSLNIYRQALIERRRPRNYEQYGLVKKTF